MFAGKETFCSDRDAWDMAKLVAKSASCEYIDTTEAYDAVRVDAFNPKLIPFEFENVIAARLFDVVPPETLNTYEAVIEPFAPLNPNEMPFAF